MKELKIGVIGVGGADALQTRLTARKKDFVLLRVQM